MSFLSPPVYNIHVIYTIYILLLSTQTANVGRKHGFIKLKVHVLLNWEGLNGSVIARDLAISSNVQKLNVPLNCLQLQFYKSHVRILFSLCFNVLSSFASSVKVQNVF